MPKMNNLRIFQMSLKKIHEAVITIDKKKNWIYTAVGSMILSVASLLLPIITYKSAKTGQVTKYNIFKLLKNDELINNVFVEYRGQFLREMSDSVISVWVVVICLVGLTAIVLAIVGIKSMTKQYESAKPFRLAICGLVGTAIPSLVLLTLYMFSKNQYAGTMHLGAYIFVTPIAMVIACLTVTSKYRLSQEEAKIQVEAKAYIRPAGDLPVLRKNGGNQYGQ